MVNKRNKGITLIALIITIIVLLILAGITIGALTSNNGVLNQGIKAKNDTGENAELEKVRLAVHDAVINASQTVTGLLNTEFVSNGIKGEFGADAVVEGDGPWTYTGEYAVYDIDENGGIDSFNIKTAKKLGDLVEPLNYGDYIKYNVDLNGDGIKSNDWRIFYKNDEGNVFIIAASFLDKSLLPSETGMVSYDENQYSAHWPITYVGTYDLTSSIANKYKYTFGGSGNNNSEKLCSCLLNPSLWSTFATGLTGAEAVGAPTLEMFISSWNEKGYGTKMYKTDGDGIMTCDENGVYKWFSDSDGDIGFQDDLYFVQKDNAHTFWLATPSDQNQIFAVESYSYEKSIAVNGLLSNYCVRPFVCLPSTAIGTKDSNGVWNVR